MGDPQDDAAVATESAEDEGEGTAAATPSMPGATSSAPEPADDGGDASTSSPGNGFIDDPDGGGVGFECDPMVQDCPAGEKCMWWANDGGSAWNSTRCSPIYADPDEVGEPCEVEGNGVSGIDSCELGAMCWNLDPETNEGTCVGLCTGDESNPTCADPSMICEGRGPYLCLPTCCPIEQDCPDGQACYPVSHRFSCAPDASGDMGSFGDPCEFINVCNPGLLCIGAYAVPDCEGSAGCCSAFCEVGSSSCSLLHPDLECMPWYEEDQAPPGLDTIGACAVPE
ncbi:MAG: ribulose phosphate epimerase [Myxococcota bacterium]